jgi:uncharacterized protein YraI
MKNAALAKTLLATAAGLLITGSALAQTATATATLDLNIRSGPGPQHPVVGVISSGGTVLVQGCLDQSMWCQVDYSGTIGWAYSDYLVVDTQGQAIVLTERPAELIGPVEADTTANSAVTGAAGGAVAGALIAGPIGAAVGGAIGATAGAVIDPPEAARTYVISNPVNTVYLEGEVVVGAQVPETVAITAIPDYEYSYAYINGQPVLISASNRQIVYVFR